MRGGGLAGIVVHELLGHPGQRPGIDGGSQTAEADNGGRHCRGGSGGQERGKQRPSAAGSSMDWARHAELAPERGQRLSPAGQLTAGG
jgi:hypothetical protein